MKDYYKARSVIEATESLSDIETTNEVRDRVVIQNLHDRLISIDDKRFKQMFDEIVKTRLKELEGEFERL